MQLKQFFDTFGIESADVKDEFVFYSFAAFRTTKMQGKAADCHMLLRMIRKIEVLGAIFFTVVNLHLLLSWNQIIF